MGGVSRLAGRQDDWSGRYGLRARLLAQPPVVRAKPDETQGP